MNIATIKVCQNLAQVNQQLPVTRGLKGATVVFECGPEWKDLTATVVFRTRTNREELSMVDLSQPVVIPEQVTQNAGQELVVGISGTDAEGTLRIPTIEVSLDRVLPSSAPADKIPPGPDWPAQIEGAIKDNRQKIYRNKTEIDGHSKDIRNLQQTKQKKLTGKIHDVVTFTETGEVESRPLQAVDMGGGLYVVAEAADAAIKVLIPTTSIADAIEVARGNLTAEILKKAEEVPVPSFGMAFSTLLASGNSIPAFKFKFWQDKTQTEYPASISSGGDIPSFTPTDAEVGTLIRCAFANGTVQLINPPAVDGVTEKFVKDYAQPKTIRLRTVLQPDGTTYKAYNGPDDTPEYEFSYRDNQTANRNGIEVVLTDTDGREYNRTSQSGGPSPYFRFANNNTNSGITTQRVFTWQPVGAGAKLTLATHTTSKGVSEEQLNEAKHTHMVVTVTEAQPATTPPTYKADKSSLEVIAQRKGMGTVDMTYTGNGTDNPLELHFYSINGRNKEVTFEAEFENGNRVVAILDDAKNVRRVDLPSHAVRYDAPQALTPAQQKQARGNIGANGLPVIRSDDGTRSGKLKIVTLQNAIDWGSVGHNTVWFVTDDIHELDDEDFKKVQIDNLVLIQILVDDGSGTAKNAYIECIINAVNPTSCSATGVALHIGTGASHAVKTEPQDLTPEQQEQARKNIGAQAEGVIDDTQISNKTAYSSLKTIDTICPPFNVTGPIVTCYPVADYPLHVVSELEVVQEGTGDPSPDNVRPFKLYNGAKTVQTGKNLIPFRLPKITSQNGITITKTKSGEFRVFGQKTTDDVVTFVLASNLSAITPTGSVFLSGCPKNINNYFLRCYQYGPPIQSNDDYGDGKTFRIYSKDWNIAIIIKTNVPIDIIFQPMLSVGAEKPAEFEPYQEETFTATFQQPVLGGKLDWEKGYDNGYKAFMAVGDASEGWGTLEAAAGAARFASTRLQNLIPSSTSEADAYSDRFRLLDKGQTYDGIVGFTVTDQIVICPGPNIATTLDDWLAYLQAQAAAGTPVTFVIPYVPEYTPVDITGSPVSKGGEENYYSDTGDTTVSGRADPNHIIKTQERRIAALEKAILKNK